MNFIVYTLLAHDIIHSFSTLFSTNTPVISPRDHPPLPSPFSTDLCTNTPWYPLPAPPPSRQTLGVSLDSLAALIPPPDLPLSLSEPLSLNSGSVIASGKGIEPRLGQGLEPRLGQELRQELVSDVDLIAGAAGAVAAAAAARVGDADDDGSPSRPPLLTRSRSVRLMGVGSPSKQPKQGLGQPLGAGAMYGSPLYSGDFRQGETEALTDFLQAAVGGEIVNMEVYTPTCPLIHPPLPA